MIVEVPTVAVLAVRLVTTALVVVEFPTIKSVMLANVATRDEKKPLVEVLLVAVKLVTPRLVAVAFVKLALVAKKLVELLLVITEEEAKMFCVKRFKNLFADVPSV